LRKDDTLEEIGDVFSLRGFECASVTPTQAGVREKSAEYSADFLFVRDAKGSSPIRIIVGVVENQCLLCCIATVGVRILLNYSRTG
jgi:hypothetical protein